MKILTVNFFTCLLVLLPFSTQSSYSISSNNLNGNRFSTQSFSNNKCQHGSCSLSLVSDEFKLMDGERIGNLRLGLSEDKVKKVIHCSPELGSEQMWGADALYHQDWNYADCGISLGMTSREAGAPKSIDSINVGRRSRLRTRRGIGIGSTWQAVARAYAHERSPSDTTWPHTFVAGSIYGGLEFRFKNDKVSSIFLGASAE